MPGMRGRRSGELCIEFATRGGFFALTRNLEIWRSLCLFRLLLAHVAAKPLVDPDSHLLDVVVQQSVRLELSPRCEMEMVWPCALSACGNLTEVGSLSLGPQRKVVY